MTDKPKRKRKPAPERASGSEELVLPDVMPVLPSGANVIYPQQLMPVMAVEERDKRAIDEAASSEGKLVAIFPELEDEGEANGRLRLRDVGTVAGIVRMAKAPDGSVHAILQGRARVRLISVEGEGPPVRARLESGSTTKADQTSRPRPSCATPPKPLSAPPTFRTRCQRKSPPPSAISANQQLWQTS